MRVLVAEDEERVAEAVARRLRRAGAAVDVALDGGTALAKARAFDYDVLGLDRDLPELHGDDVCRAIHASGQRCASSCSRPTTTNWPPCSTPPPP
jgi:two-component system response regulator VanR